MCTTYTLGKCEDRVKKHRVGRHSLGMCEKLVKNAVRRCHTDEDYPHYLGMSTNKEEWARMVKNDKAFPHELTTSSICIHVLNSRLYFIFLNSF